jgi:hypothetical protein
MVHIFELTVYLSAGVSIFLLRLVLLLGFILSHARRCGYLGSQPLLKATPIFVPACLFCVTDP